MLLLRIFLFSLGIYVLYYTNRDYIYKNIIKKKLDFNIDNNNFDHANFKISDLDNRKKMQVTNSEYVVINIKSKSFTKFCGTQLVKELSFLDIHLGKWNIFHKIDKDTNNTLFSIASIEEPGSFTISTLASKEQKGISLFFLKSEVKNPSLSFDEMFRIAKILSFKLNGDLFDCNFEPLTLTVINSYTEKLKCNMV